MVKKKRSSTDEFYEKELERLKKKHEQEKKFEKFWLICIPTLCIILLILLAVLLFLPNINLKGSKQVIVEYGKTYKEKGYTASYFSHNLTKKVKVSGKVNNKKIGKYKITYKVSNGFITTKKTRTVIVADTKRPKISLFGDKKLYVCPNKEYKELGFRVSDNYDENLTKKVKVRKYSDKVIYTVRDNSHNFTKVTRKLIYKDIEKPEIKLNGGDIVYSFVGEEYKDPGYEVIDNCDSNLSKKVEVIGNVDTNTAGTYKIKYKVKDAALNETEKERTVIVSEHGQNGTIYLTFDDGPRDGTTNIILDILRDNGVKATFFITNYGPDELVKREFDEGHTVALHTASHNYSTVYASVDDYFRDLEAVKQRADRITGEDTKIIRFPGGSSNTISRRYSKGLMSTLTDEVVKRGFHYFDWNIYSGDAGELHDASAVANNVTRQLRKDRVNMILMHDIKSHTRDALDKIIKFGKDNGYIFDKITMSTEMMKQKVNN